MLRGTNREGRVIFFLKLSAAAQADIEKPPVYIFIALHCSSQLVPRYFNDTDITGNVLTVIIK